MTDHVASLKIEAISHQHLRDQFDCGQPPLNEYLLRYARQNDDNNIAKAFVAVDDENRVLGYYCISSASVEFEELPEEIAKGLPRYPMPAALIGRLACAKSMQGKGLGARLLIDALQRINATSEQIGIKAVIVDAINQGAKKFYMRYGFMELRNQESKLFLPIETIKRLF